MKHSISKSGNVMIVFGYVCDYGFDRDIHMNMDLDVVDTTYCTSLRIQAGLFVAIITFP